MYLRQRIRGKYWRSWGESPAFYLPTSPVPTDTRWFTGFTAGDTAEGKKEPGLGGPPSAASRPVLWDEALLQTISTRIIYFSAQRSGGGQLNTRFGLRFR